MFKNDFGEINLENNQLNLKILDDNYTQNDYDSLVDYLEKLYLNIDQDFILIADISVVSFGWSTYSKYNPIINLFTKNREISIKYLKKLYVINCNNIVIRIMKWLFYIYGVSHDVKFINNSDEIDD
tara:strand:- start:10 stop:387 length:378 start_codon:yes stop_codon:yes gene_type:complete